MIGEGRGHPGVVDIEIEKIETTEITEAVGMITEEGAEVLNTEGGAEATAQEGENITRVRNAVPVTFYPGIILLSLISSVYIQGVVVIAFYTFIDKKMNLPCKKN